MGRSSEVFLIDLDTVLKGVSLLAENEARKTFSSLKKGAEKLADGGLIPAQKARDLRKRISTILEGTKMIEINSDNVVLIIKDRKFVEKRNWKIMVLCIMSSVPEGKYVSKQYFDEFIMQLGMEMSLPAAQFLILGKLANLVSEGHLEKIMFSALVAGKSKKEAQEIKCRFTKEKISGPCKIFGQNQNQSVFRITETGREYVRNYLEFS